MSVEHPHQHPRTSPDPTAWATVRAIAWAIAAMRRGVMREAPDGFDHLLEPDRVGWRGQIDQDEDFLVRFARREGLVLGPVRPK